MLKILFKSLKDLFNKKIFFISLIPVIVAAIFWGIVFFIFHNEITNLIISLVKHIPFVSDGGWIVTIVETIGGIFIYYELIILTSIMLVGVVADKIVEEINLKDYNLEQKGSSTITESIKISLKQNLIFIVLFVILLPTMFIPLVNILVNIVLWMILIQTPMFYDSLAIIATKDEFNILKKKDIFKTKLITFLSVLLFLIPIFGLFVYIIQLLIFTHYNLQRLKKLR